MTIYFYKADDDYGCFSNFSLHEIEMEGTLWMTVEHYYQSRKFISTVDEKIIPLIHAAPTPDIAASLGRDCDRIIRPDWDLVKTQVMKNAVRQKFYTHSEIRETLLGTGDSLLVEDSPKDYFWGCGADRSGKNQLGQILMEIRTELSQKWGDRRDKGEKVKVTG